MTELELVIQNSPRLSARTKVLYTKAVKAFLVFAGKDPGGWTGIKMEDWRNSLSQTRKPQTVNGYLAALRYASKRLAQRHQNPQLDFAAYAEMMPRGERRKPRVLTLEEGRRFLASCGGSPRDLRDRAAIMLGLRTGLRRAGICGIRFEDFIGDNVVTVTLKGGRRHNLTLDQDVMRAFNDWGGWLLSKNIEDGFFFRSLSRTLLGGAVSVREKITPDGLYSSLKRRAEEAGIDGFYPHVFRHTFVSWARKAGIPDYRIQAVTGHKVGDMIDRYTTDLDPTPVGASLPALGEDDDGN